MSEAQEQRPEVFGLHHIQVAMPLGEEEAARAFYAGLLGLTEVPKPEHLAKRGGCWFKGAALEFHLGVEQDFRAARKAHPAFSVRALEVLRQRLEQAGVELVDDTQLDGHERFYAFDPFGNRLEFIERRDS